jgi:hypothetical protein
MPSASVQAERRYQADLEWIRGNADKVWEILNADDGSAEMFAAARSAGGVKAAVTKQEIIEARVLERLADLTQKGTLPPARNLVSTLTAVPGLRRDSTRAALKRLAAKLQLPDVYRDYFS